MISVGDEAKSADSFGTDVSRETCKVTIDEAISGPAPPRLRRYVAEKSTRTVAPADRKRLDELLAKLPDDGSRLPPAGRRLIVQAKAGGKWTARVYDRANAPDEVLEILRLSQSNISAWTLRFEPQHKFNAHESGHGGCLTVTPDRKQIIFTNRDSLQFWNPATHESLGEVHLQYEPKSIAFSPDGSLAALDNWVNIAALGTRPWHQAWDSYRSSFAHGTQVHLSNPYFTGDGKHLALQSSDPKEPLYFFDTRSWNRVGRLPDVPEGASQYMPAIKKPRAVIRVKSGAVALWDTQRHAVVAELEHSDPASRVVFSPDESLVVVVGVESTYYRHGGARVCVWKTDTGKFVRQLRLFEQECPTQCSP